MAINAAEWSVGVNGDIRHVTGTETYTVLELHRWLQDLADNESTTSDDLLDITSDTPSERSTDNIITLNAPYNIDDDAAQYLFAGSITQSGGDTVYSGLQVLGAVNNAATQLMVIQNSQLYPFTPDPTAPFWGDQSNTITGDFGYNGAQASGVLMRCMIKTREFGADINGKRIRVQARHWGDTYDFFNVTLGQGESVAAIGTTPDAQNDTPVGTVTTYTHVVNSGGTANAPTGGFQGIDLNNGEGSFDYYSQWTYGADTSGDGLKGIWEYIKELSGHGSPLIDAQDETSYDNAGNNGTFTAGTNYAISDVLTMSDGTQITVDAVSTGAVTQFTIDSSTGDESLKPGDVLTMASVLPDTGDESGFTLTVGSANLVAQKTIDSLDGQLFLGVTHGVETGVPSGAFTEREIMAWGTELTYNTGTDMNLVAAGDRIVFSGGAGGEITYTSLGAATGTLYVLMDSGEANPGAAETFTVYDDAGATTSVGTVATIVGGTAGQGGTGLLLADDTGNDIFYYQLLTGTAAGTGVKIIGTTSGASSAKTIPKIYLGSYTGTLIGAYGIGVLPANLTASDTIEPLVGVTQTPPNNVTFTVTGLISGEDRVLVGPRAAGILEKDQFAVTTTPLTATSTALIIDTTIPTDTPSTGNVRIENNSGVYLRTPYSSYTGSTFTITAYGDAAAVTNNVFIAYIDETAAATSASFTSVFLSTRDLFVRVRDGGVTPIKTFEAPSQLTSSGGTIAAIRTSDL